MNIIQIKRGMEGNLPILLPGELAFTLDTKKLYVGTAAGNVMISADLDEINDILTNYITKTELSTELNKYATINSVNTQLSVKLDKKPDGTNDLVVGGKINSKYIDSLYVTDIFVVENQAEMLALTDAKQGDFAIREDLGATFALKQTPANVLANWVEIPTTSAVVSVNGKAGVVNLGITDIPNLNAALNAKLDVATFETENTKVKNDITSLQNNKVDKIAGKGLSTNDYTTAEKTKLSGIEAGAQKNRAIATETQAKAGTSDAVVMTPLKTDIAIKNATIDAGEF